MISRRRGLTSVYLLIVDLLALTCAYLGASLLYFAIQGKASQNDSTSALMIYISLIIVTTFFSPNSAFEKRNRLEEFMTIFKTGIIFVIVLVLISFIFHRMDQTSRLVTILTVLFYFLFDIAFRFSLKYILWKRNGKNADRIYLVTDEKYAGKIIRSYNGIKDSFGSVYAVILTNIDTPAPDYKIAKTPVLAGKTNMFQVVKREIVDEIILYLPETSAETIAAYIREFQTMGVVVHVLLNPVTDKKDGLVETPSQIAGYPAVTVSKNVQDAEKLVLKRIFDLLIGFIGSLITILLTIFIGPAIKLDSKGPIFFKQKRVGRNGRYFYIYKFRSMCNDAEAKKKELMAKNEMQGGMFKMEDDPRITKVGKFLRKTSLDEFPQFFNILIGDMSFIGTRPPTVDEFKKYEEHHKRRLTMKPGLTGMWQVSGRSDITDFEKVVRLDCYYIDNWSLTLDLKIFFKTILVVFTRKGSK